MTGYYMVDNKDEIEIRQRIDKAGATVKIGFVELEMSNQDLEFLYEKIEQELWDESEHSNKLRERIEELENKISELEEQLEGAESALENIEQVRSW